MNIEDLYLEVTRTCTLKCEHCLRGDSEQKQMSIKTLENTLKDLNSIDTLLLSGGEPLLNIRVLAELPKLIRKYNIKVKRIGIITNGTVISKRHIEALKRLMKSCTSFEFYLSSDLFHRLEWDRLGIRNCIERNFEEYNKSIPMKKYLENDRFHSIKLNEKGRAKKLTKERLQELKDIYYINYKLVSSKEEELRIEEDAVKGKVCIDVNGFLVGFNESYEEEDADECISYNVNCRSLVEIIPNLIQEKKLPINKCYNL